MAYKFKLYPESLKREFSVYVVIAAKGKKDTKLYVGKTGDNRDGCNPIISRCGNHFSYNKIHSQVRNKIPEHEQREYTYIFDHFGKYNKNGKNKKEIDHINEMERWLNKKAQEAIQGMLGCELVNPYSGKHISKAKKQEREKIRKPADKKKIDDIVKKVKSILIKKRIG